MSDFIDRERKRHEEAWSRGYHIFSSLLKSGQWKRGAEIGVAFGGHAEAMLEETDIEKLYGIDSFEHIDGYNDPMNYPQKEFDSMCMSVRKRLGRFGRRFELVRARSKNAARSIPGKLDFVYIDADHSYDGCLEDIVTWLPKVREGGIIGGHDYNSNTWPGVTRAVNYFFAAFGWEVHYEGHGCWWTERKKISGAGTIRFALIKFKARIKKGMRRFLPPEVLKMARRIRYGSA